MAENFIYVYSFTALRLKRQIATKNMVNTKLEKINGID